MNRQLIILIALLLGAFTCLQSQTIQSRKAWLAAADTALLQKDYYPAFKFYEAALTYDTNDVQVWFKYAESARNFNAYTFAEAGYMEVLEKDSLPAKFPQARLWLAQVRQKIGKYGPAKADYQAYLASPAPNQPEWTDIARKGLSDCEWALEQAQLRDFQLPPRNLGPGINNEYSDFGAVFQGDTIYYSSFRYREGQDKNIPERPMIRVLRATNGVDGLFLSDSFNIPGQHIAYSAFTPDHSGVYYAVCEYLNASDVRCDLFYRKQTGPDQWGTPLRLGINQAGVSSTQPAVGIDASSGQTLVFFSSDRPGGKKGLDLWVGTAMPNGDVQQAENLRDINTDGNDISPSFHQLSQQLFFSSDGRVSFGGYDIYQTQRKKGGVWGPVKQLTNSVNTSFDDVYYTLNAPGDKAMFSSNRWGSTYIEPDKEACCYDIYEVLIDLEIILNALTFNRQDSTDLTGTTVYLYEITPEGEKLVATKTNPEGNDYEFALQRNKKYRIVAQKDDFIATESIIDLTDLDPDITSIRQDLYLDPLKVNLQALTFDATNMSALKGARVQLFEIIGADTVLVGDLVNEIGNDFHFSIGINRAYLIQASKPGFNPLTVPLNFSTEDVRKLGRQITVELPLEPTDFKILPIALYFDNGSPDGRSVATTTKSEYGSINQQYYAQKQVFIDRITDGMPPEQKFITTQSYENFFDREVKDGMKNLLDFSEQLEGYLSSGYSIVIELQGYASPRASTTFNQIISQRRTMSVSNFFRQYKSGVFLPYLKNGQLEIIERGFGETKSRAGVPDRLDDIKGSIYSLTASLERRVEIVKVRTRLAAKQ